MSKDDKQSATPKQNFKLNDILGDSFYEIYDQTVNNEDINQQFADSADSQVINPGQLDEKQLPDSDNRSRMKWVAILNQWTALRYA